MNKGYVYIICDPSQNLYKIGVTKNPYGKRIKQLQTGNGTELHLVKYYETSFPFRIEAFLHRVYNNKKEHGEWFRLDINDILSFNETCKQYENIIDSLKENPFFSKNLH